MNKLIKELKDWFSARSKKQLFFIVIGLLISPQIVLPLLIIYIIFREKRNEHLFNNFWYIPFVLTFGIFVFTLATQNDTLFTFLFENNRGREGIRALFFPLMGIFSLLMIIPKIRTVLLKLFSKIYKDKNSFNYKVIYTFMLPILFLYSFSLLDMNLRNNPGQSSSSSSSSSSYSSSCTSDGAAEVARREIYRALDQVGNIYEYGSSGNKYRFTFDGYANGIYVSQSITVSCSGGSYSVY